MAILIVIIVILLSLLYFWIKKKFNYWSERGFVQAEASFPFGSIGDVGRNLTLAEALDYHYRKFKGKAPVIGYYNFLSPTILPIDPELIKDILVGDFPSFHDRGFYYNKKDDPVSAK